MRMQLAVMTVTAILALPLFGQSKSDWNAVRRIDRGRLIRIKVPNRVRCRFVDATDNKLFCDEDDGFPLEIDRTHIHELRLELTDEDNAFVNACIGASAGIAAGAISNAVHRDVGVLDPILGLQGAIISRIGLRGVRLVHGRVIYKR